MMMAIYRAFRVVLVVSAFVWFWAGAVILAWTVLPLVALFSRDQRARIRRCQRIQSRAFQLFHAYMRVLTLLDARVTGTIARPEGGGPVVIVANHTTLVDVTAILSRFPHACCLTKPMYLRNPFIGRLLRLCGFISTETESLGGSTVIAKAIERLEQGFDVLVFPEGTRSPPGELLPFQLGAFEIACRAKVPLVPFLLQCTPSALTRDRPFWKQPDVVAVLTVQAQPPVDLAEIGYDSQELRTRVEARYRTALGLLPPNADEPSRNRGTLRADRRRRHGAR